MELEWFENFVDKELGVMYDFHVAKVENEQYDVTILENPGLSYLWKSLNFSTENDIEIPVPFFLCINGGSRDWAILCDRNDMQFMK